MLTYLPVGPVLFRHLTAFGVQERQQLCLDEPDVIVVPGTHAKKHRVYRGARRIATFKSYPLAR